ncbi:hypothetical protein EDD11_003783 [Mortierella claussenii]|nr:hypothetical protein EDD11_003783 [Mortierella claussenii]
MNSWKDVYRERHKKDALVRMLLQEMVEDSRNRMHHMDGIAGVGMIHAQNIINGRNAEERDLTRTYYARKTLKRLQRGWVLDQWRAYRFSNHSLPIWQGCALMAMFSDHEMELSDIDDQFQDLADEFLAESPLAEQDHVLVLSCPESRQDDDLLDEWAARCSRYYGSQVERIKHLIQFFTQEKGFKGNTDNYYDPFNSFIDKVLTRRVGIPISLCIVFAELAQRVGLAGVELMGFPQHFMVRWGLYVLWLKYLSNFWPEDVGFVRTSIEDMKLMDQRRPFARGHASSSASTPQGQRRPRHVLGHHQGGLFDPTGGMDTHLASTQETIKIMRTQVRELEMTDEAGDVGEIRRRKRPKAIAPMLYALTDSPSTSNQDRFSGQSYTVTTSPTTSSPTIDEQSSHAGHHWDRQSSISGEQQNGSYSESISTEVEEQKPSPIGRVAACFGGEERRRPEPEYYVGEVFRHLVYRYTGAIYGYDLKCEAQESWIQSMGIDLLPHGRNQPFYNALLSDGSKRYVAQENIQAVFREYRRAHRTAETVADQIQPSDSGPISTSATVPREPSITVQAPSPLQYSELGPLAIETVGQYFEAWDGQHGHYVMNKELRKLYPTEDYQ